MKLIDRRCIQINTMLDQKTSYIIFQREDKAKIVYSHLKLRKKSAIMKELTTFSENVEALHNLLKANTSTESFDIMTKTFNNIQLVKELTNDSDNEINNLQPTNRFVDSNTGQIESSLAKNQLSSAANQENVNLIDQNKESHHRISANKFNPLRRDSKINKFIVPSLSNLRKNKKSKYKKKRFQDDNKKASANIVIINNPNRLDNKKQRPKEKVKVKKKKANFGQRVRFHQKKI